MVSNTKFVFVRYHIKGIVRTHCRNDLGGRSKIENPAEMLTRAGFSKHNFIIQGKVVFITIFVLKGKIICGKQTVSL